MTRTFITLSASATCSTKQCGELHTKSPHCFSNLCARLTVLTPNNQFPDALNLSGSLAFLHHTAAKVCVFSGGGLVLWVQVSYYAGGVVF